MRRSTFRQVLECGSPVPLSIRPVRHRAKHTFAAACLFQKRHGAAALQNAGAQADSLSLITRGAGKRIAIALFASLALSAEAAVSTSDANAPITWVFLNTGAGRDKTKGMSSEEVGKMQAAHVGNFGALFEKSKLYAAGPLGDNGVIRGIVVLNVTTPEQIAECFKPDPFIQNDILAAETHPWRVDIMKFGAAKTPFQMDQNTLCIVKKGRNWLPAKWEPEGGGLLEFFPALKGKRRSEELAISGPFLDSGDKLGVLMFYSSNHAQIKMELEKSPAVSKGLVEVEIHPQYLGAGTFRSPNDAPPKPGKRVRLFDGKTIAGWEGDTQHTWRIEKDALVGGNLAQTVPHNDFFCTTREFKNFDLRLKVKLAGTGFVNGGIQFRSQRLKSPAFEMTGYQADVGEGYWGCLYDESRRNKILAHTHAAIIKGIVKANDWNDYIVRCEDRHIRLWLNGVLTVDYTEQDKEIPVSGFIGLQIHGGGKSEASYRDITIEELP